MSTIEVNKITPAGSETTVTLGDSGDSIDITSGATVTNFKSTGIDDNADATAITIDSSENVLVKKTAANDTDVGITLYNTGKASFTVAGDSTKFNRTSDNGQIVVFQKDGTTAGSINVGDHDLIIGRTDGGIQCYLRFAYSNDKIIPCTDAGATNDDSLDLGDGASRFDDIHATNGTIQTSDETEKQSIQSLTSTEIAVAKKISKLFKTFKFNSAVEKKGDSARTHTGVIAQNIQQAFTDEGLDSGDYGMFISSTWWENDEGHTKEEETEGYTKKTRLGIRYPELLSFISSAFEQRLTDLESRVAALEE
jgi:hypothetical protein